MMMFRENATKLIKINTSQEEAFIENPLIYVHSVVSSWNKNSKQSLLTFSVLR